MKISNYKFSLQQSWQKNNLMQCQKRSKRRARKKAKSLYFVHMNIPPSKVTTRTFFSSGKDALMIFFSLNKPGCFIWVIFPPRPMRDHRLLSSDTSQVNNLYKAYIWLTYIESETNGDYGVVDELDGFLFSVFS